MVLVTCIINSRITAAAAEAYNAALKFSPDSVVAHDNLAGALREQGQFDAAVEEAQGDHARAKRRPGPERPRPSAMEPQPGRSRCPDRIPRRNRARPGTSGPLP